MSIPGIKRRIALGPQARLNALLMLEENPYQAALDSIPSQIVMQNKGHREELWTTPRQSASSILSTIAIVTSPSPSSSQLFLLPPFGRHIHVAGDVVVSGSAKSRQL
ncbi:hypothetical protein PVAR5_3072 [Paecilomyces variotii No. 5]|uniref:Uncharacterized protein n=1 Tax=Byssochlamys spectabilis (strain No. 5 / NBRC 109023) TaxID=1356009 RepID=V5FXJ6_BYSSN|nr:hypothetical protein PVAR5_3072 [Paecilomyces variotii No. 5]